jgi:4-amino-4-deoxy-L-arabinose transferase-like glycosyltransferase
MSSISLPYAAGRQTARTRLLLGSPAWVRPSVLGLAAVTFALYAWGLDRNGWANTYYSAAVQAGAQSWKAFFFGSLDAGNFITVDKPPAALWLMELSARIFGLSSWSILLPEALAGVACVLLLFVTLRRSFGPVPALIGAAVMAATPVAVVMFRYNNPDALLTLLLVAAAWALTRALDGGRTRWLLLSAGLVGLAFNTKDLQAYIVLPALVGTYFLFGPAGWRRRFMQLLGAGAVLLVSSGWWMTVVDLIPAASRPYIGGSTDNSVLNLVLGYNGLGRILGEGGPSGGALAGPRVGGGAGFGGAAGLLRLFNNEIGGQVTWLLPLAAIATAAGLWLRRGAPRTDLRRAGYVLWGGWLLTHFVVFSFASGIFHPYYTIVMAPAIGALVGAGLADFWVLRSRSFVGALFVAAALVVTAWWGARLLDRTPEFMPGLATVELGVAVAAALLIAVGGLRRVAAAMPARLPAAALVAAAATLMLGPSAYALATVGQSFSGPIASAGPATANGPAGFGKAAVRGPGGGAGATSSQLIAYLEQNQGGATWLVAVQSAQSAASIELATGKAVLAMGGFSGSDPAPTARQLAKLAYSGQLRFVLLGNQGGGFAAPPGAITNGALRAPIGAGPAPAAAGRAGSGTQAAIQWVQANCSQVTVSGVSGLYDCAS